MLCVTSRPEPVLESKLIQLRDRKKLLTNTGSCHWVISVPLLPVAPQPSSLLGLLQRGQRCSSMWPHPAPHRMMLSCIRRQSLEHALALQLQELSYHQTWSPEGPKPKKSQATLPGFPSKETILENQATVRELHNKGIFLYIPCNIPLLTALQHVLILSALCYGF